MNLSNTLDLNSQALGLYNLTSVEVVTRLLLAIILGTIISAVFIKTDRKNENNPYTYLAVIFCPAIITTALIALGNSIATAFGLFAALSIVRFRTPVKNIKEMLYIFLSISIGICTGIGAIKVALISTFIIVLGLLVDFIIYKSKKSNGMYTLRLFVFDETYEEEKVLIKEKIETEFKDNILLEVRTVSQGVVEIIYSTTPNSLDKIPSLINDLRSNKSVKDIVFQAPILL